MSPEPFVSRAKASPAKRSQKGYGDETEDKSKRAEPGEKGYSARYSAEEGAYIVEVKRLKTETVHNVLSQQPFV